MVALGGFWGPFLERFPLNSRFLCVASPKYILNLFFGATSIGGEVWETPPDPALWAPPHEAQKYCDFSLQVA